MPAKYYQQHPERSQFADAGLMIALAVIVVTAIKLMLYGITVVTLVWLAIALLYMAVAAATRPNSAVRTGVTAFFMVVSVAAVYASFFYDFPIMPKRESNLRADQDETNRQDDNRKIQVETPTPVPVETDVVSEDASKFEDVAVNERPADYPTVVSTDPDDDEDIELVDLSANSHEDDNSQEVEQTNDPQLPEPQPIEQFDEEFQ